MRPSLAAECERFTQGWAPAERAAFEALTTPQEIQSFLNRCAYNTDDFYRSPPQVLRDRRAHCYDGAVLAAAALYRLGERPLIVDLRAVNDDDHVIAVFKRNGRFGAIAKSNTTVLRFREPVYRGLRELAMSYFDFYYNLNRTKTLRQVSVAVDLRGWNKRRWLQDPECLDDLAHHLDRIPHTDLLTPAMIAALDLVDDNVYEVGFFGADPAGLYQPT